ncbi:MAG: cob(I)yrinic acid a,c-diamide adenosyltransferase [Bacteroidia bacterium]|nr:cob(I)yrinic acid a,c-diamide adenosyltransferase [Bacteroidia bacterium]
MKIYTKTGDKGETSLLGGTRVSKAHHKLEAYGTVDELNSTIGLIAAMNPVHQNFLLNVQHKLFNIGSELAAEKNLSFPLPELTEEEINVLEKEIDRLNEKLPKLKNFILPGGSVISAHTQIARCVCRRAERNVVGLNESKYTTIIGYLNRLSDYLFVLSRDFLRLEGVEEIKWEKE